jgi:hypothetical protein
MTFPDRIDARWIASLTNEELQQAESELRVSFAEQETLEKQRRGSRYELLRGPEVLTSAWLRWSMVSNATRARGLSVVHRS